MITTNRLLQVLVLTALSVTAARAAEPDKTVSGAEETFKSLDKNSDQRLRWLSHDA